MVRLSNLILTFICTDYCMDQAYRQFIWYASIFQTVYPFDVTLVEAF